MKIGIGNKEYENHFTSCRGVMVDNNIAEPQYDLIIFWLNKKWFGLEQHLFIIQGPFFIQQKTNKLTISLIPQQNLWDLGLSMMHFVPHL